MTEMVKTFAHSKVNSHKLALCSRRGFSPEMTNGPKALGFVVARMPNNALRNMHRFMQYKLPIQFS